MIIILIQLYTCCSHNIVYYYKNSILQKIQFCLKYCINLSIILFSKGECNLFFNPNTLHASGYHAPPSVNCMFAIFVNQRMNKVLCYKHFLSSKI